jgi:hypothetical protein
MNSVRVGKFNSQAWGLRRLISSHGCWVEQDVEGNIFLPHMKIQPDQVADLVACILKAREISRRLDSV